LRDPEITIVFNEPFPEGIPADWEEAKAELGVLECVNHVHAALLDCGYIVHRVGLVPPLESVRDQLAKVPTKLVFNLFEGFYDFPESEADVADILFEMDFRFTGCHSRALRLALDKAGSKTLLSQNGIDVPDHQVLNPYNIKRFHLNFPCIVKPRNQDASHGITPASVVNNFDELKKQVSVVSKQFGREAIVEEFAGGREFNITVIGNEEISVLPVSEIVYLLPPEAPRVLTYEAKWITESEYFKKTTVACPAQIDEALRAEIAQVARTAYRAFECAGYARVDLRMDNENRLKVLEVNPNPDISPDTGAARQAYHAGIVYSQFIDKIVDFALERVPA
jgi:D-alanine-D-alanine ligase